jgi:hypothetical protein
MSIPTLLTNYLSAKARHAEAKRLELRAVRTMEKLAKRNGGSAAAWTRACNVAGVSLADHRSLAAYRDMVDACAALRTALRREPVHTRLAVVGTPGCGCCCPRNGCRVLSRPNTVILMVNG